MEVQSIQCNGHTVCICLTSENGGGEDQLTGATARQIGGLHTAASNGQFEGG